MKIYQRYLAVSGILLLLALFWAAIANLLWFSLIGLIPGAFTLVCVIAGVCHGIAGLVEWASQSQLIKKYSRWLDGE